MANDKSKYDKLEKEYTESCISEYYEDWESYNNFYPSYWDWQEDYSYNYDYYVNSDGVKLCVPFGLQYERQMKLDELLGLNKKPTIGDILKK
jgi:hypothetical protein